MTQLTSGRARRTRVPIFWKQLLAVFEVSVKHHYAAPWKAADRGPTSPHSDGRG